MKSIYIINKQSRSLNYGIGTYTEQLIEVFKLMHCKITVVILNADEKHLTVDIQQKVRFIKIPKIRYVDEPHNMKQYLRNSYYILYPFLSVDSEIIFHFNFLNIAELGTLIKARFKCIIIFAIHCTEWSLTLSGDTKILKKILNNPLDELDRNIKKAFEEEQFCMQKISDHIIAISAHSAKTIKSLYKIPASKITIIPNGIADAYVKRTNKEKSEIREYFHISPKEIILIFAGRMDSVKGVEYLIDTFKLLLKQRTNVRLIIAGEGHYTSLLKKALPYWTKISFTGFISKEELYKLYSIADIGIVPSLYEEFGLVAIEMLMNNLAIIVNKTTGLMEIVKNGINGEYISIHKNKRTDTVTTFCDTLLHLIDNPKLRKKYIKEGRKTFLSEYELTVFKKNINDFYGSL